MRWVLIAATVFIFALASCDAREELPTIEETLPPGYTEWSVPQDLAEDLAGDLTREGGWIRCFDTDLGWQGLNDHVSAALKHRSYTCSTARKLPYFIGDSGMSVEQAEKLVSVYSAPSNQAHVMVVNLDYRRTISSAEIDTTGSFMVMVGRGRLGST